MGLFGRNGKSEREPRTLDEVLRRQPTLVNLGARGAEGLRLPYDQDIADRFAAGLARMYRSA